MLRNIIRKTRILKVGHVNTKKTYTRTATTSRTCYYSGNVQTGTRDVYSTKYKATYSGVVKPTTTVY